MTQGRETVLDALERRRAAWRLADSGASVTAALAADCVTALQAGGQVYFCGNGGSASQAEHLAAELVGRYLRDDRPPLAAVALSASGAVATALGNDYGFETVYARQVEALARPGDIVIGLSTSGRSANVLAALAMARKKRCLTGLFTGADRGLNAGVTHLLQVPSSETPAIQEMHLFFGHLLCELIENAFTLNRQ